MIYRPSLLLIVFLFFPLQPTAAAENEYIRHYMESIRSGAGLEVEGAPVASVQVLPALYERRHFTPVWTQPEAIKQLFEVLDGIDRDGLDAADYHIETLKTLRAQFESGTTDTAVTAGYDILLTDSLIRLGYHLLVGKVDPVELDNNWNMEQTIGDLEMVLELAKAIDNATIPDLVDSLRPQHPVYDNLRAALARYREIEQQGGWQAVAAGPTLKPGMTDARVVEIRRRLAATQDIAPDDMASPLFDAAVEEGVKRFQQQYRLSADGLVGKATVEAMNVPVKEHIDQIRVNLERARWVLHDLPSEFVLTDIAGFRVNYFRDGKVAWSSRAQVGKPYRKTPVFRSRITYLEINPTWTVPPTILRNDILPKVRKDPDYLRRKDMRVLDYSGKPVDESTIDWNKYATGRFPYLIRQNPGPGNALGRIKFMFPNKHAVYLHDTPSKSLFDRNERAFSSGCIRVQNPYEFAELLLKSDTWNQERILQAVDARKTQSVSLPSPVTVILLYWTVNAQPDGRAVFKKDIYDRDGAVLAGLERPFSFRSGPILDQDVRAAE